jgi:hypothetical protein
MEISELNKALLKQILKTSQGFGGQTPASQARTVPNPATGGKTLSPTRVGHPISSHVRGADAIGDKTKFCSLDDQVEALWLLLNTTSGIQALRSLRAGVRQNLSEDLPRLFPIEAPLPHGAQTFTTAELTRAGILRTRCVAIIEGRSRGTQTYLHVHTCFPKLTAAQITALCT